jgi:hypothetical protein
MHVARTPSRLGRFASMGALVLAAIMLVTAAPAMARSTIMIGTEEVLRPLQDVQLQNGNGEPLYLGHKLSFRWLGLPYAVSDDGYVLGVKGRSSYLAIGHDRIAEWQAQGHLPSPLPTYRLGIADYLLGNLLWIVTAGVLGWAAWRLGSCRSARGARPVSSTIPSSVPAERLATPVAQPRTMQSMPAAAAPVTKPVTTPVPTMPQPARIPVTAQMQPVPVPLAQVARLPVARTVCRVKSIRSA